MEIFFKSLTGPQTLLNLDDVLAEKPWEALSDFLCIFRDLTLATNLKKEHRSFLLGAFQALQIQESLFRQVLKDLTIEWTPTPKEENIIQDACAGLYEVDDIEGAFGRHGGLHGIIALIMVFRASDLIITQWRAIEVEYAQQWLASNVSRLFKSQKNNWIDNFTLRVLPKQHKLQYLEYRSRKRRRILSKNNSDVLRTRSLLLPQSQKRHKSKQTSCQQLLPPIPITSSPDQVPNNKRLIWNRRPFQFQQDLPSSRCNTSSPVQDLPQHQQLQENHNGQASSPAQQFIPTPTSNTSLSGEEFLLQHQYLSITSFVHDRASTQLHILPGFNPQIHTGTCSSTCSSKSPSPADITNLTSLPANNETHPPLSLSTTPGHALANILNTEDYISPLERCDGRRSAGPLQLAAGIPADHAMTIPPSTSPAAVSPEIIMAFQELDHHTKDLATLLCFLGEANIPTYMLRHETAVDFTLSPSLHPLFAEFQHLGSALHRLKELELITYDEAFQYIITTIKLRSIVECISGNIRRMEYKASLLVFHSFPVDPDAIYDEFGSGFIELATSLLPHVKYVLKYLDAPGFIRKFSTLEREKMANCCLASSRFGDLDWKLRVLTAAEKVILTGQADFQLSAKLQFRKVVLSRLYPIQIKDAPYPPPINVSSKMLLGEQILFRVQSMIDRDELSMAWEELQNFIPIDPHQAEENRILQMRVYLEIRVYRFAGLFQKARCLLETHNQMVRSLTPRYFSAFTSINCECGAVDTAYKEIPLQNYSGQSWLELGGEARRVSLAAAGTRLMNGLWILKKDDREFRRAQDSLSEAKRIYEALDKIYSKETRLVYAIRHTSTAIGLAMIMHLECRFAGTVTREAALLSWQNALKAAEVSLNMLGGRSFPQMIISYTMCDITTKLGFREQTTELFNTAKGLYSVTGHQFQYLGLGSLWFDMVQDWNQKNGVGIISELSYEDYIAEQTRQKFPFIKTSVRLCT